MFYKDDFHGKGAMYHTDGSMYKGEFKYSDRAGFGTFFFKEGHKCEGLW